jgi:hypothetical protein
MRQREIINTKQRLSSTDMVEYSFFQSCIDSQICPYCKDGKTYKMLALHISLIHGISAYDLREEYQLNRGHKLVSAETSEKMSDVHKIIVVNNKSFMNYNRRKSTEHRYEDGRQRKESLINKITLSNQPQVKNKFIITMKSLNRKEIAKKIDPLLRKHRASIAGKARQAGMSQKERSECMERARSLRTPESEKTRINHTMITMNKKYWNDPEWVKNWEKRIRDSRQHSAKIPRSEYQNISVLYESGMTQRDVAKLYGVSHSLIGLILKSYKLNLPILPR